MSDVKRYAHGRYGMRERKSGNGDYVLVEDYDALEAEAQALREEVAALRARVVVVPEPMVWAYRRAAVPYFFFSTDPAKDNLDTNFAIPLIDAHELARLNGKVMSEGLLRESAELLEGYAEVIRGCKADEIERFDYLPSVEGAAEELRALLGEGKEAAKP